MTGNDLLHTAVAKLNSAAEGKNVLLHCAEGLNALIAAASLGGLDPALSADAQRLLFASAPQVADETAGRLAAEHIFHSLGCANAALTCADADRFVWLLATARVLESELRALHLRDLVVASSQLDLAHALSRNPLAAVFHPEPLTAH